MIPYYTGANETGQPQRDAGLSVGGFRSGSLFPSMEWDTRDPMVGVVLLGVSGGNGRGVGTLTAVGGDGITWTPPGGEAGDPVSLPQYEEAIVRGANPGAWVRLVRRSAAALSGAKSITLMNVYNNLFPDVETADAVAGLVTQRALMLLHDLPEDATDFAAWVEGPIEIALEEPTGGELLGIGLSWNGGTSAPYGSVLALVPGNGEVGVHVRRTVEADTDPAACTAWAVHYSYTCDGVATTGAIRGLYRVEREDWIKQGLWIALDGAVPDFEAAPDETWTSRPHTTSLGLTLPATVKAAVRQMNKWGLWGVPSAITRYNIDVDGASTRLAPSGPSDVSVQQTSGNLPTVGALYDAAADGDDRGVIWVIWLATDGTTPDGSGDPDGYALVQHSAAIDDLAWTGTGDALIDGTPVSALVRLRRLDALGEEHSPDVIQLDDSGPGTLKFDLEISDWDSSGYLSVTSPVSGRLIEVVHYSALVVSSGQTTVTVDERGLMGTTAQATRVSSIVTPVTVVDSENTTAGTWDIVAVAPGRPGGAMLYGDRAAQAQAPVEAPDVSAAQVLDVAEDVRLYLGEGRASLYVGSTLVWLVLMNGTYGEDNGFYIPSEWSLVNGDISGAASGDGTIDAVDGNTIYVCVRGVRRMLIDLSAMTITAGSMAAPQRLTERAEQDGELPRFGSTMFLVWDPEREDYRPYFEIGSDGVVSTALPHNQLHTAAELEALWP